MAKPKRSPNRPNTNGGQRPPARQQGANSESARASARPSTNTTTNRTNGTSGSNGVNGTSDTNGARTPRAYATTGATTGASSANATAGSEAMRQRVQARRTQRRYEVKRSPWRGPVPVTLAVVGVLLVVGIIIAIANSLHNNKTVLTPVAANVLSAVEHPSSSLFDQVGTGGSVTYPNIIKALPANTSGTGLPAQNGKPVLMYAGAEYCPYCAADRWSLVMALSRFGTFSNLHTATSLSSDVYPSTPTFTFVGSSYSSPYLVFDAKEIQDASGQPLQTMTTAESNVFNKYDAPPYDSTPKGIPFIDFGGQYMTSGASYNVGVLHQNASDNTSQALSYSDIVNGLKDPNSQISQGIVGTANTYTAAICKMINNSDKAVCSSNTIQQIEAKLPQR